MRLLRLPVAAGRLQRVACGSPPPLPPPRARLIARRSSGVVDARAPEAEAAHPVAACGFCAACGVTHSLPRTPAAEAAAAELLARVRATGRLDFDAPVPDTRFAADTKYPSASRPRAQGQMLGVLLASDDATQQTHVLKAFSGQMNGAWVVPGWAPPLGSVRHDNSPVYALAFQRITALGTEAAAAQAAAAALGGAGARRGGLRKGWADDADVAALEAKREAARTAQRAVSRALLTRIWDSYAVANFKGESKHLLQASLLGDATRGGTGDCCAPKLLHAAQRAGLRPLSMAEFWYGSPVGGRVEGRTYDACQERCQQLLGYMLCGSAG